jgi:ferric-dicitrate binding protein FerR (iron transport regulator)
MFGKHVISQISAFVHGELPIQQRLTVESHLKECAKCRAAFDEIRLGARLASTLSLSRTPDSVWNELQQARHGTPSRMWPRRAALAGTVAMIGLFAVLAIRYQTPAGPSWEVTGMPGTARLRPGEELQTDSVSEAKIKIADIGELEVERNTRIRLLVTHAEEHRIALDRGKVEATTWAPPRLFIVETPAATAIDLGCKYTLEVEEDGSSLLHVTLGLVALEREGRETIVPAGAFCRTRAGAGPGTPFFEDSTAEFQSALRQVDVLAGGSERMRQLEIVLRESRVRDAVSLWHLLPRLDSESRGLIYDRLAKLLPPPPESTREGIIALDANALDAYRKIVSQLWQ